ncbi:MAG TPA: sigma-70 family RNA polymerase sigma factor [Polyangiaceae bacterium]|nr:sigma-70 family RNA polymerase sigma factor [Polyangiaceae bacterium]
MTAQDDVREMYAEGQHQFPSLVVAEGAFQHYCERLSHEGEQLNMAREHAGELYLCCACSNGDLAAIRIFKHDADELVRCTIARFTRDSERTLDTLQEFWRKLLVGPDAKVNEYLGRGSLMAWLRICAARMAIDRQRSNRVLSERETDLGDCIADQAFGPESTLMRARFGEPFRAALRRALSSLSRKERNLLRMHVVGRCSIDQIGRAYNVHRATAARWLEQTREHILHSVRAELQMGGSRLTDSEFQSVARVVGGELELETPVLLS